MTSPRTTGPQTTGPQTVGVVLVHGIRTSRTMWRAQEAALGAAGVPVRTVDLPGHGELLDEPFTVAGALAVIDAAVKELGGRAVVVGMSLGGYLSIEYAARYPAKVVSLVAAGCSTSPRSVLREGWVWLARRIEATSDSGARLNAFMVRSTLTPEAARDVAAGGFALGVMSAALTEVGTLDPLTALRGLRCPVWLVNGRFDHFRTQERAYLAAARSSGQPARLVVVPRAWHLVSLDAPVAFSRIVLDVVERAGRAASVEEPEQPPRTSPADEGS